MAAKEFDVPMPDGGGTHSSSPAVVAKSPANRLTLHLGVIDQPYANYQAPEKVPQAKKGKANKPIKQKSSVVTKSTGEVAEILEEKYGIMQAFADTKLPMIAKALENSIAGELETLLMGGPPGRNPFAGAESSITTMMKNFISSMEVEQSGIEGVPTQAALDGVNHRLKKPYAKANPRRPSFIDTSLYMDSMICWFD